MVETQAWTGSEFARTLPSPGVTPGAPTAGGLPVTAPAVRQAPPVSHVPATWQQVVPARTGKTLGVSSSPGTPNVAEQRPADPMALTHVPQTWRQVVAPRTGSTLVANPVPTPAIPRVALEPRTGRTLMDTPALVIPAAPPVAPQGKRVLGATLVGMPSSADLTPGTTMYGNPYPVDPGPPGTGDAQAHFREVLLRAEPEGSFDLPPHVPHVSGHDGPVRRPTTDPPPVARASEAPESNRLARRSSLPPPDFAENRAAWLGGYQVLSRLRSDAVGTAYLCRPVDDPGSRYVLKVLRARLADEVASDAYLRFANRLAKLFHPNVHGVLDAGVHQQQPYLVRPHVDAARLTELLAATSPQARPPWVMLRIFEDVLEGLIAAHERRQLGMDIVHFVHGALSSDHVLVRTDGRAMLSGVGEVTILGPTSSDPGQDLLALRLLLNAAIPGGVDEKELRLRWFVDAKRGPEARAAELLQELREMIAPVRFHAGPNDVAAWLRSVRESTRPGPPAAAVPAPAPPPVRARGFAAFRAWWKRRFGRAG